MFGFAIMAAAAAATASKPKVANPTYYFAFRKSGGTSGIDQANISPLSIVSKGIQTLTLAKGSTFNAQVSGYGWVSNLVVAGVVTGASYVSSNPSVVTIPAGSAAPITAVNAGTANIKVTSVDGKTTGVLRVTVTG